MKLTEKELLSRFGTNLSKFRKSKNLSLRELAKRCDIDFSSIGKMERGTVNVSIMTIALLADGLEIHPKKLLDFEF